MFRCRAEPTPAVCSACLRCMVLNNLAHRLSGQHVVKALDAAAQVQGKTAADHYLVFPTHYCSCKAFLFDIVGRGEAAHVRGGPASRSSCLRC